MWRWGLALPIYTKVARSVGIVTSARVRTVFTKVVNFACSGRRVEDLPLELEGVGRPMA